MSRVLAAWLFRWRRVLTSLILIGAAALAPRANITRIDNDLTAWFSRDDPVYREYERFRDEFGGTRSLIVAIQAPSRERLLGREGFGVLEALSGDIERVRTVDRVTSLADATVIDARPAAAPDDAPTLDVRSLVDDLASKPVEEVARRALDDDFLRGDLVSEDGTVTAIVVFFDEARVDAVRAEVLDEIRGLVQKRLPADFRAYYNGSIEISETYNRITLSNQTKFT